MFRSISANTRVTWSSSLASSPIACALLPALLISITSAPNLSALRRAAQAVNPAVAKVRVIAPPVPSPAPTMSATPGRLLSVINKTG